MKRAIIVLVLLAVVGAGVGAWWMRRGGGEVQINTATISRGEIIDTVGSTGTLQAVTTVQVGSQVSGNISWLGADFNSIVKENQVIARLDPSLFQAQVDQSKANLLKAQADVARAKADTDRSRVALQDAQLKYTRARELATKQLVTQQDLDTAKLAVDTADTALQSAIASQNSSQASVVQSQASLSQAQVNLDHCTIAAPIDGIVIQRSVDVGQTVAASMQAPTLFIIAADLTKMQVNANIDEADVGRIRPQQNVTFRVDAYPGEEFQGSVAQIRLQPVVVQNVTTYATIINVPNPGLKLKPGMTANLRVQIARRPDVLRVPNAALRFRPSNDMFAALNQPVPQEMQGGRGGRGGRNAGGQGGGAFPETAAAPPNAPPPVAAARSESQDKSTAHAAAPAPAAPAPSASAPALEARGGGNVEGRRGDFGGGSFGGGRGGEGGFGRFGGGDGGDRQARMMERLKAMSPDEQQQFIARMKERGMDTTAFEKALAPAASQAKGGKPKTEAPAAAAQTATTIDALFAPLPTTVSQGRVWTAGADKQLKSVRVRLGITDGTNTELLNGELEQGTAVVTGIVLPASARPAAAAAGNPFQQGGGRGPGGFGGGFPGGGRGR
jgi:HlyD family secretion protein